MNLVKTLKDYVNKVDNLTQQLASYVSGATGETVIWTKSSGETQSGPTMSPGFKDYLKGSDEG